MVMHELLYQHNPWWENDLPLANLKPRDRYLAQLKSYLHLKQIIVLTGLRRVGKTSLMKLIIAELIEHNHVDANHIFYISLDDYTLQKVSIMDMVSEFRKLHKIPVDEKVYLFFDEITAKADFHIQLKNLYDAQNVKIFAE